MASPRRYLTPLDVASIAFLLALIALNLLFASRVAGWRTLVLVDLAVITAITVLAALAERRPGRFTIGLHRWYCYPLVLVVFKQIHLMVRPIHPIDYDSAFIAIDRWIFGTDPTVWMAQFAHPVLTEIFQIAYFSYYLLFVIVGVEIYRRFPVREFDRAAFLLVYGFYLSYLGYFLVPAVGPRFTLHDFQSLSSDLPGLFLTEFFRSIVNAGESIPKNVPNPVNFVQRDVFPSGHTQMTLITVFLAYQYRLRSRTLVVVVAALLITGTVYLRYHYVIDVIGGALFFGLTIWSGEALLRWRGKDDPLGGGPGSLLRHRRAGPA